MIEYIKLLTNLIETPSFSGNEDNVALIIRDFLKHKRIPFYILHNNTWTKNLHWDPLKPVILLNSHIDTVKPVSGWTHDPFSAKIIGDKIIGLGSNDAGGSLVTLLAVFLSLYDNKYLPYNLIYAASAEEEITGKLGMECLLKELGKVNLAIIGEPTNMQLAVAEKGLLVLDCISYGIAAHAAHGTEKNAIYMAMNDILTIKNFHLDKISPQLGEVKFTVTQINAGFQHNVIPDTCSFVIDVRTNEHYSNEQVLEIMKNCIKSEVKARSTRLSSSSISLNHPIVKRANELGIQCFGSATLSDQCVIKYPSIKIGPGCSNRSHAADEFILLSELNDGFNKYNSLLKDLHI